jgi:hypothetical protein
MNTRLAVLRVHVPARIRRAAVRALFEATADAFGCQTPPLDRCSDDELRRRYARFTRTQAELALDGGDDPRAVEARLERNARRLGAQLRVQLRLTTAGEAMDAARVIYGMLGIDFRGTADGDIAIPRCFFSDHYTARVCRLIGALDAGLLAGLSGGGRLEFTQRITEGAPCCLARLRAERRTP